MFDNNVFKENTCVNVEEDGKVIGFEMQTNITYYRGIPMSMIEYIKVAVDGEEVPTEDIRISLEREDWFTLKDGGLSKGTHKVKLTVATRTAYIPVPLEGIKEREVVID